MRDLFSQCTCLSRSGMSICTHCLHSRAWSETHASHALTVEVDRGQGRTLVVDNGGHRGQCDWSSATYVFCEVEC